MVKLAPVRMAGGLGGYGKLKKFRATIDDAFASELDEQIAAELEG